MKPIILTLGLAAFAFSAAPALADDNPREEYREKRWELQEECQEKLAEADSRYEYYKAIDKCDREFAKLEREFRKDSRKYWREVREDRRDRYRDRYEDRYSDRYDDDDD